MLTHQEHLAQAVHNENAAKFLKATPVVDWAATAVFYSALHYVDAYISKGSPKAEFRHHGARETVFEGDPLLFSVYSDYKDLKKCQHGSAL